MSKEQERKGFPIPILGVSEATLFGKRQGIRAAGMAGDYIKMAEAQGEPTSSARFTSLRAVVYDACARHGELPALQKILDEAALPWSTRMKLYMAYKAALAYSDANVYTFLDIYISPPYNKRTRAVLAYWRQLRPALLAVWMKDKGFIPPTLAMCVVASLNCFRNAGGFGQRAT